MCVRVSVPACSSGQHCDAEQIGSGVVEWNIHWTVSLFWHLQKTHARTPTHTCAHTCTTRRFFYWQLSSRILQCLQFIHMPKKWRFYFQKASLTDGWEWKLLFLKSKQASFDTQPLQKVHISASVSHCGCGCSAEAFLCVYRLSWDTNTSQFLQKLMHYWTPTHQQIFLTVCDSQPAWGVQYAAASLCEKAKEKGWKAASLFPQLPVDMSIHFLC